jgi:hypothetical protein
MSYGRCWRTQANGRSATLPLVGPTCGAVTTIETARFFPRMSTAVTGR